MNEEIPSLTETLELLAADAVKKIRTRMHEGFEKVGSSAYGKKASDYYADADRWIHVLEVCIQGLRPSGPVDATDVAFEAIKRLYNESNQDPSGG